MTWSFLVLVLTAGGVRAEPSARYPDAVSCERARAQVIREYATGARGAPGVRIVTLKCVTG